MKPITFARWIWYEQLEPFGELRADWRSAQITAMLHNVAVGPKQQKSIEEFLLKFGPKEQKQTVAEQLGILKILAASYEKPGIEVD